MTIPKPATYTDTLPPPPVANLSAFSATPSTEQMVQAIAPQAAPQSQATPQPAPEPIRELSAAPTRPMQTGMALSDSGAAERINAASAGMGIAPAAVSAASAGVGALTKTAPATTGGFLAALPGIASGIGAVGSLVSMGVQWYYAAKQMRANEAESRQNAIYRNEATAEERRRFNINLDLTKEQIAEENRRQRVSEAVTNRRLTAEEKAAADALALNKETLEETKRINRVSQAISLLMGTIQLFNSPQNREQNYNFWAGRAR